MFVKVVKNNRGRPNTSFIAIVESYREERTFPFSSHSIDHLASSNEP